MLRAFRRMFLLTLSLAVLGALSYSFTESFSRRWRGFVIEQFEGRGVHIDFQRFGLSLVDGLVARDVKVYADPARTRVQLTMDRLNLDLDYGRLMNKQFFVEGVELTDANVSLPLDPDAPDGGHLNLTKLSARIYLMDDRLDIRRAEGDLAGVHVVITGTLRLDQKLKDLAEEHKDKPKKPGFKVTRELRTSVQHGLQWLDRFAFKVQPELALDISGSIDKPEEIAASMRFTAHDVRYETYVCKELTAIAEFHDRLLDVRRVSLRDDLGVFDASGTWPIDSDEVRFSVNSSADLAQLARSFFANDELREVVFYESSAPILTLEGTWFISGPKAGPKRPVEALGKLKFGRFNSRGEIFDGLSASFGVSPQGYYIRDATLRHKTGNLALQAMSHDTEGFRYRAVMRMDPHAFLHFAGPNTTRLIKRFEFDEHSTVFVQVDGAGPQADIDVCRNVGRMELHDFKYRGVEFSAWSGDVEFLKGAQIFRNVSMVQAGGSATAHEVYVHDDEDFAVLKGVKTQLDPVPLTSCFAKPTAEALMKYHFGPKTQVELEGTIDYGHDDNRDVTDVIIHMKAPGGTATYPLWERNHVIHDPMGTFTIKGKMLGYDLTGELLGAPMSAKGHVELGENGDDWSVVLKAGEFRHEVLGKDLPFRHVNAVVKSKGSDAPFDISGEVLGGKMTLKGTLKDEGKRETYRGELNIDAVSFQQFATVYAPGNDSIGDITGHFQFTGKPDDWKALKGSGVLIILNGNLYALPVLGPLTPLLGAVLPSPIKGYNIAHEANCNFQVADGFVVTNDFEALTSVFRLVMRGRIDFIKDDIDFYAQARMRGLPGFVLRPVSELLEYKGEGPVGTPVWKPHLFGLGDGSTAGDRKPPSKRDLEAAQRAAVMGADSATEKRDRPKPAIPSIPRR